MVNTIQTIVTLFLLELLNKFERSWSNSVCNAIIYLFCVGLVFAATSINYKIMISNQVDYFASETGNGFKHLQIQISP